MKSKAESKPTPLLVRKEPIHLKLLLDTAKKGRVTTKKFDRHRTPVAYLISFRPKGTSLFNRLSTCYLSVSFDVGIMIGVQGAGFFRALEDNLDWMFEEIKYFMGYVKTEHVERYREIGLVVEEHHEKVVDGNVVVWIIARRAS